MSPYHGIRQTLAGLAEQVNDYIGAVSTSFPGKGTTVDAANAKREAMAAHLGALADWLQTASSTASAQAEFDKGLESAPSPEDIKALREACFASGNDPEVVKELKDAMAEKEAAQTRHNGETSGTAWGDQPAAPAGCPVPGTDDVSGDFGDGTGGGLGDLGGDRTGDPDATEGAGDEDTPVSMSGDGSSTPVTMTTGSEPESPVTMSTPLSDTNVGTETSADTAPTAGAGTGQLTQPTQATPGGTPMQGTHGAPNAAFGASGGAPGQLSQPQGARVGASQSPEKRREAADKRDEQETVAHTAAGVAGGAAMGAVAGGLSASSPTTNTSGAQGVTPSQGTPPPTNTPPAGGGVMGGAGGVRPPNGAMGSGETVNSIKRPVILRSEEELNRELDELLGIHVPDDRDEEPKR